MPGINKVQNFSVLTNNALVKVPYDEIDADYAGSDFDVYTYKLATVTVATVTVTWTSAAKAVLLKLVVS